MTFDASPAWDETATQFIPLTIGGASSVSLIERRNLRRDSHVSRSIAVHSVATVCTVRRTRWHSTVWRLTRSPADTRWHTRSPADTRWHMVTQHHLMVDMVTCWHTVTHKVTCTDTHSWGHGRHDDDDDDDDDDDTKTTRRRHEDDTKTTQRWQTSPLISMIACNKINSIYQSLLVLIIYILSTCYA